MGTKENEAEHAAQQAQKEQGTPETEMESTVEHPQESESTDTLKTYTWHSGSKGTGDEGKEGGGTAASTSTVNKIQKASTSKWSKMQTWRKSHSEDPGDRNACGKGGEANKMDKGTGGARKNPFRRALSEPPGSLFATLSSGGSANAAHAAAASVAPEASAVSCPDTQRGGGGALIKKYFRTVSQKLKRPRLQSRHSANTLLPGKVSGCMNRFKLHSVYRLG